MPRPGETLLTAEARQTAIARYQAGDTPAAVAAAFGVSESTVRAVLQATGVVRTRAEAQALRGQQQRDAVSPEERAEIRRRYAAGEGLERIAVALGWGRGGHDRVRAILAEEGVPLRDPAAAAVARWGRDVHALSAEGWRELYWAPGSGYPSVEELGRRFGVKSTTVRRALAARGITLRTAAEQQRLDIAAGRRAIPDNPRRGEHSPFTRGLARGPEKRTREHQEKLTQARRVRAAAHREERPCRWCGQPVCRTLYDLKIQPHPACCPSHAAAHRAWVQQWGPGAARPLIVAALRQALGRHPPTSDNLERLAGPLGASEAEILAVLTRPHSP